MPEWLKSALFSGGGTILGMVIGFAAEYQSLKSTMEKVQTPAGFNEMVTNYLDSPDYRDLAEKKMAMLLAGEKPRDYIKKLVNPPYEIIADLVNIDGRVELLEKKLSDGGFVKSLENRIGKLESDNVLLREHVAIDDAAECCKVEDNILRRWCIAGLIGWVNRSTLINKGVDSAVADRPCIVLNLKRPPDNVRQTIQDSLRANPYVFVGVRNNESALKEKVKVVLVWGQDERPRFIALANNKLYQTLGVHAGGAGGFRGIVYIFTKPEIAGLLSEYHPVDGWSFFNRERGG